jgi:hypothetical protein
MPNVLSAVTDGHNEHADVHNHGHGVPVRQGSQRDGHQCLVRAVDGRRPNADVQGLSDSLRAHQLLRRRFESCPGNGRSLQCIFFLWPSFYIVELRSHEAGRHRYKGNRVAAALFSFLFFPY